MAAIEGSEFAGLWAVLAALRAHDERFAATARNHLAGQTTGLPLTVMNLAEDSQMQQFAEHLRTRIIDTFLDARLTWDETLEVQQGYVAEHGRAIPSREEVHRGVNIGLWVRGQRTAHAAGELSDDRRRRLEAIPGWTWERLFDEQWDRSDRALERWAAAHGHARPEQADVTDDGIRIGMWVSRQRRRRTGQLENSSVLRPDQVARLDRLPGWTWRADEARWCEFHALVTEYFRDHDHDPASGATFGGRRLRPWIDRQRREQASGDLPHDRAARLEAIPGWTWSPRQDRFAAGTSSCSTTPGARGTPASPSTTSRTAIPSANGSRTHAACTSAARSHATSSSSSNSSTAGRGPQTQTAGGSASAISAATSPATAIHQHTADLVFAQWSRTQRRRLAAGQLAEDQARAFAHAESLTSTASRS